MASYNRVILIGNLCRDRDFKRTPPGFTVSELRLAVNESFRNRTTNEKTDRTCYVDVTVWNQQAELCRQYLSKGSPLFVEGRLVYDEWKTPAGETRSKLRVQADRVQFLSAPPRQQGSQAAAPVAAQAPATPAAPVPSPPAPPAPPASDEEEIPF